MEELEEAGGASKEDFAEKLHQATLHVRDIERNLVTAKKETSGYQDMLKQIQVNKQILFLFCSVYLSHVFSVIFGSVLWKPCDVLLLTGTVPVMAVGC